MPTIALLVGLGMGEARAERRVDWSQYLEPAGASRPTQVTPSQQRVRSTASGKKASRSVAKKSVKKSNVKARSKAKKPARTKRRR